MTAAQTKAARRRAKLRNRHKAKVPMREAFAAKAEKKGKKR